MRSVTLRRQNTSISGEYDNINIMPTRFNKKKILGFIANFSEIAKKSGWISHYDADSDSLGIRAPKLSHDVRKRYLNDDEFAFYLNGKGDVQGIFIEYFLSNFVAHRKDLG